MLFRQPQCKFFVEKAYHVFFFGFKASWQLWCINWTRYPKNKQLTSSAFCEMTSSLILTIFHTNRNDCDYAEQCVSVCFRGCHTLSALSQNVKHTLSSNKIVGLLKGINLQKPKVNFETCIVRHFKVSVFFHGILFILQHQLISSRFENKNIIQFQNELKNSV